ncbi:MAG TPA: NAD(+)--rifampin ADP-ribosyltransferase [Thermoanaerobaculia bacterium]|jgi:rifampin ADP-ribosylating transferase
MTFDPNNPVIQLCIQGIDREEKGAPEEARRLFLEAWHEATNGFEKFMAAHFVARHQGNVADKLKWLETALQFALEVNDESVAGAFPALYSNIARCYEESGDHENARRNRESAISSAEKPADRGPFYHGTKADLRIGDFLTAGFNSNYSAEVIMNHIYFTALVHGAGLAAALAKGEGRERVYVVEPTGSFEHDPNVTDRKFPGNPTRSYRTEAPLKVVGEVTDWARQTPEQLAKWREKLASNKGIIIN